MRRRHRIGVLAAATVAVTSIVMPALAWARYGSTGSETNTFATHVLLAPGQPTCSGLGVLSVTLSWTAPADTTFFSGYDLGSSTTSGGPYTYTNVGLATSKAVSISAGDQYYVVRTEDLPHLWKGSNSPERHVVGVLFLLATCP